MIIRRSLLLGCILALSVVVASPARAVDLNEVTTMLEKGNKYDFRFQLAYEAMIKTTALNREYMGNGATIDIVKDLIFKQITHTLDVRLELALYKDLGIYLSLPVILQRQASYSFGSGSRYVGYDGEANCRNVEHPDAPWMCNPDGVNARNSRIVQDGLATGLSGFTYDPTSNTVGIPAEYAVGAGQAGPRTLFDGPARMGVDQLHLGLHGLIFSQKRHGSLPDWRFGAEFRIAIGKVMDFNRDAEGDPVGCSAPSANEWNCRPQLNDAVGRGVHEIRFFTTLSRYSPLWKNGGIDAYFHLYFQMPMGYLSSSFYASRYDFSGQFGEESKSPTIKAPMKGGLHFGGEFRLWEDPVKKHRVSFEVSGMLDGHFEGRDYSEAYELLAGSPTLNLDCTNPSYAHFCSNLRLRDRMLYFPGVGEVENFIRFGARVGFHVQLTGYVKLQLLYTLVHEQEHFLAMDDAGRDNPAGPAPVGGVCTSPVGCADGLVNIGTNEQNPWHRPAIHQAGHRIRAQETLIHQVWIGIKAMF
jgi:hypothetical protein